jgi:hypothetical protein
VLASDIDVVGDTSGLLELAICVFVQEYPDHPEMTYDLVPAIFLVMGGTMLKIHNRDIIGRRIFTALGGHPEILGHTILSTLNCSLLDANYSEELVEKVKQTMTIFLDAGDIILEGYMKANGIRILTKAWIKLCAKMYPGPPSEMLMSTAGDLCSMLEQTSRESSGYLWVMDVLTHQKRACKYQRYGPNGSYPPPLPPV